MTRGLEPAHASLSLSRGLVRILCSIVQAFVLAVLDTWTNFFLGGSIARQFIGDNHTRYVFHPFEQLPKKLLSGVFVAPTLDQDIKHLAMLIHRAPQILSFPIDGQKHLIQMPRISQPRAATLQLIDIRLAKVEAPLTEVSWVSTTPRSAISSSTSRKLSENRKYSQTQ